MKTLKTLSVLAFLLCCSFYSNAQILCGVHAGFYQDVNLNNVATFHDTSIVSPNWQAYRWRWNFGDGDSSNQQFPNHTYFNPGIYDVTLTTCRAPAPQLRSEQDNHPSER